MTAAPTHDDIEVSPLIVTDKKKYLRFQHVPKSGGIQRLKQALRNISSQPPPDQWEITLQKASGETTLGDPESVRRKIHRLSERKKRKRSSHSKRKSQNAPRKKPVKCSK
eukprot:Gregarina_sp_Poly_1__9659@NODE_611_length_7145_cov_95_802063_g467_i0_p8_GENE_NODE_611_length_7145_cov_95_802063_g467_i0NODE_611_length_7145_cov_95_802063_g467_i0_p8_ORF_typecomplete_len110_score20_60SURF6/PF04935_12/0_0061DUF3646/PF12362_8/0_019_NODE_611_length_7145_cov_95_802063_g467_i046614990